MKLERTKNATRNIFFGLILKVYQIIVPFLMRTAMIRFLGMQYLGLNSLFTSVLQVLNLAELGVGSAMIFSMYKPIIDDDRETICALMKLYRLYYRVIGGIIAAAGLLLTPFITKLIHGDVPPDINVYILYLMNLAATVLSYWLFAYKNSILNAHQRTDITSKVTLVTNTLMYIAQFVILAVLKNYYFYVIAILATQALTNILTAVVADRLYPQYQPEGNLSKTEIQKINQRIRDLFTSKIGSVVVNSVDTIVISAFLGLTMLAVYQNYYYIMTAVIGVVEVIFVSCTAGIGNSLVAETKEKNFKDLKKLTFMISWISGVACCCFLCMYQPFMVIWVGKDHLLPFSAVICLVIYYFVYEINRLLNTYKDAGGIWREDRFRPLVTAISNLCMNLIFVQFWGIYGIILSTVISMLLVGMPWLLHNLFTTLFQKEQLLPYLKKTALYSVLSVIACALCGVVSSLVQIEGILGLLIRLLIAVGISNLIFFVTLKRKEEFKDSVLLADKLTKGKLKLSKLAK